MTDDNLKMNVIVLGVFGICIASIIISGYIHGNMHFSKVLETLSK